MDLRHVGFSGFHVAAETAIACLFLALSVLIALIFYPSMFCCHRQKSSPEKAPSSPYSKRDAVCKRGLFALMLARLEEFDQLTPLVTPASSVALPPFQKLDETPSPPSHRWRSEPDTSPPPPRRPQQGRTLIVPLLPSRYRPAIPLLGTPDSRVTSLEAGTSKSCATIPEDDEDASCDAVDDLVSIDRTSMSISDRDSRRYYFSPSAYNLILPQLPPEYQSSFSGFTGPVPVPLYSAPDLPRPQTLATTRHVIHRSPSNGSAHSSVGTGSPADTTGSVSDSFYINSDVISSANGSQVGDLIAYSESDAQSKYILHRIEEESEADSALQLRGEDKMPRSISQQFELMRQAS